jgi:hypothetical protein
MTLDTIILTTKQYAPLKRQSFTRLHGAITQKAVVFIFAAVRT